jgi:hypothetical protein
MPSFTGSGDISDPPSLPPGDPGTDEPGTDDPNGDLGNESDNPDQAKDARTSVPRTAVLDAATVASVVGGAWTAGPAPADSCTAARPAPAVGTRSSQLQSSTSRLVETVATHHGAKAAIKAVRTLEARLVGCGAKSGADPRIGDAAVQLTLTAADGTKTLVTAAAVEGVTFVLSGSGPVTASDTWSALTDIALGSTCAAAVDGCH